MSNPVPMVEVVRGGRVECVHTGHAVVCTTDGQVVDGWGDTDLSIYPRSSSKILQALALVESGAADAAGLGPEQLALACASHQGAAIHTDRVMAWLENLGLADDALRCGPQPPSDIDARDRLIRAGLSPCQWHNNCSGKHAGFLTLGRHLEAGPEYLEIDHPVQRAVWQTYSEMTETEERQYAIDGCSAPNFVTSLSGLARGMACVASGKTGSQIRDAAAKRLYSATITHPDLVAGEGRACTELMRAMDGRASIKTGAEGVFVAMIPKLGLGVALKITDGATRASECAIAAILVRLGVLDAAHPAAQARLNPPVRNWRGIETGEIRALI